MCIFGISKRPSGLTASPLRLNAFFKDCNYLVISAPEDRTYWFLITETPKSFGKDIPRYTKEDEQALVERHLQDRITDKVTFEDLYANRLQTTLVSVEDNAFTRWHYRRIITTGDAAHKVNQVESSLTRNVLILVATGTPSQRTRCQHCYRNGCRANEHSSYGSTSQGTRKVIYRRRHHLDLYRSSGRSI